jgi:cytoskeleton protein RodZ
MSTLENSDLDMGQGPGMVFTQAREALSITQAETADVLNLSLSVIKALEGNDDSSLPERVYVNGYIRSYAKLLGLAAEPLIQAWGAQFPDEMQSQRADLDEEHARNWSVALGNPEAVPGLGRWVLATILLSVVFIYFVSNQEVAETVPEVDVEVPLAESETIAVQGELDIDTPYTREVVIEKAVIEKAGQEMLSNMALVDGEIAVASSPQAQVTVEAKTPEILTRPEAEAEAERQIEIPTVGDVQNLQTDVAIEAVNAPVTQVSDVAEAQSVIEESMSTANVVDSTISLVEIDDLAEVIEVTDELVVVASLLDSFDFVAEPVEPAFRLPRLTLEGNERIVLSFTEDCWFEIKNVDGEILHADLGRLGQLREYFGQGPFALKLGFAQGATVEFNGSVVALGPHTRNNVAKLVLGQ